MVSAQFERGRVGFSAWGGARDDIDGVAERASGDLVHFIRSRAALDERLACGLILPLAAAAAGLQGGTRPIARFTAASAGEELLAVARAVDRFLDVEVAILTGAEAEAEVRIAPRDEGLLGALRAGRDSARPPG